MAYDPTLPVANSPISSAELRAQFAGLKTLIDTRASIPNTVEPYTDGINDPPNATDLDNIRNTLNDLIAALKQAP